MREAHYVLIALRATDDGFPLAQRVRRLLKYALRTLDMRSLYVDYGCIPTPTLPQEQRTTLETTLRAAWKGVSDECRTF
jgi:hypothetical protein